MISHGLFVLRKRDTKINVVGGDDITVGWLCFGARTDNMDAGWGGSLGGVPLSWRKTS